MVSGETVPDDDPSVPTPMCHPAHRGAEIPMHSVASKNGIRIAAGTEGRVGRAIRRLYAERYGAQAAADIPKRNVPFRGKIFAANTYFERDEALVLQALRRHCGATAERGGGCALNELKIAC